ncbi:COP23 domain-containing protein [Iningainema tapete]|uniref:Circadian oscillating protein COP23 n=1 Tax=Iningainema tapete BLCC-T55 TaxID=2748662 RepID=A0A8J7CFI2_9CYAN|nr:COP23 domain-containing protein [Iningainema tapete]MBD2774945.1 hypothetical protein [Iningainema tapete BLCC-T55]
MLRKALHVLGGVVVLSGLAGVFNDPSYAGSGIQFSCNTRGSLPTTVAYNLAEGTSMTVIRWYSEYFTGSGYDPLSRCQQVSARFQQAYNSDSLNYITAGIVNGLPVICAATPGGSCNSSNMLFTLKPGVDAAATMQRLFDVRDSASPALLESQERTYINLMQKLAPVGVEAPKAKANSQAAPNNRSRAF